ncbi:MAG TPA: RecX family transcriptional regulator [Thermoanaerobaculia bacterium]
MADLTCYDRAVRLLAARPHFRAELEAKLAQRGYFEEEIDGALDRLAAQGYLDDARTARDFVAHRQEREAEGRLRLRAELAKRGAPEEAIEAALAELAPQDDLPAAREAAERWAGRGRRPEDPAALARHLARKGFSRRAIFAVLNESHDIEPE